MDTPADRRLRSGNSLPFALVPRVRKSDAKRLGGDRPSPALRRVPSTGFQDVGTLDLGLLWRPFPWLSLGGVAQGLNAPQADG